MVLADDNFASIAHAVEEGRTVYDNLKKSILFILPTNGGEALTVIAAIMFGGVLPITPVQILWVNMVTAITLSVALAFERAEPDIMRRPPRDPGEPILSRFLVWRIAFVSAAVPRRDLRTVPLGPEPGPEHRGRADPCGQRAGRHGGVLPVQHPLSRDAVADARGRGRYACGADRHRRRHRRCSSCSPMRRSCTRCSRRARSPSPRVCWRSRLPLRASRSSRSRRRSGGACAGRTDRVVTTATYGSHRQDADHQWSAASSAVASGLRR